MSETVKRVELILESPEEAQRRYLLRAGRRLVIGRGRDVDVPIDDPNISRLHAAVELRDGEVWVCDLGSRNGTHVGQRRLKPHVPAPFSAQETLRLGDHLLRAQAGGGAGASSGTTIGLAFLPPDEFEILGQAGSGGLATVWAARQKVCDRMVAIKVLRKRMDKQMSGTGRFLREARLYAQIKSPYVVRLYDFRISHGQPYLLLELVTGPNLLTRLGSGHLPIPEALKYLEDIARGLADLHAVGIVHRDVKPENILLSSTGAKLADLGLAKKLEGSSFTQSGLGLGSLPYVSPEQATGAKDVNAQADLYALGATLYQLIARRPPLILQEASILARVKRIQEEGPPLLSDLRADCPRAVDALVQHLLQKDPNHRPRSAAGVAAELARLRSELYPEWRFDPQAIFGATQELEAAQVRALLQNGQA